MKCDHLLKYLNEHGVQYKVLCHTPAFTANQVALAAHVPDRVFAKTLLVKVDGGFWLAVLRADQRISAHLLKESLDAKHVALGHEEDLESLFPDCEVGAMPPFPKLYRLPVIIDKSLAEDDQIVFNACTHTESILMKFEDYERLALPILAQIAEPINVAEEQLW
jgi:Ala-tRNA(Pro) deacylase